MDLFSPVSSPHAAKVTSGVGELMGIQGSLKPEAGRARMFVCKQADRSFYRGAWEPCPGFLA